jgi:hypothetical protein
MEHTPHPAPGDAAIGTGVDAAPSTSRGMALLAAGVPLTLLLDLAMAPQSVEIAAAEGGGASWLRRSA